MVEFGIEVFFSFSKIPYWLKIFGPVSGPNKPNPKVILSFKRRRIFFVLKTTYFVTRNINLKTSSTIESRLSNLILHPETESEDYCQNEERSAPTEAVDILCYTNREIDACHDDKDTPCWESLPFPGKASNGREFRTDCQIQASFWA